MKNRHKASLLQTSVLYLSWGKVLGKAPTYAVFQPLYSCIRICLVPRAFPYQEKGLSQPVLATSLWGHLSLFWTWCELPPSAKACVPYGTWPALLLYLFLVGREGGVLQLQPKRRTCSACVLAMGETHYWSWSCSFSSLGESSVAPSSACVSLVSLGNPNTCRLWSGLMSWHYWSWWQVLLCCLQWDSSSCEGSHRYHMVGEKPSCACSICQLSYTPKTHLFYSDDWQCDYLDLVFGRHFPPNEQNEIVTSREITDIICC